MSIRIVNMVLVHLIIILILAQNAVASPIIDLTGQQWTVNAQDIFNYNGSKLEFTTQTPVGSDFRVDGHFDWFYNTGRYVGTEIFTGTFFNNGSLSLQGIQLLNQCCGLNLGTYIGTVAPDGNSIINGTFIPPAGTWNATRNAQRDVPTPPTILLLGAALAGLGIIRKRNVP